MKHSRITLHNVVHWLGRRGYPTDEAEKLCRRDLRVGLRILNKIKAYDKVEGQVLRGQTLLFAKARCEYVHKGGVVE